ncbi:MAG: hypothetical protein M3Q10_17565 [Chloroflexota bacterium]|nr:hypothetical protein [Chloroflexota bacterium]
MHFARFARFLDPFEGVLPPVTAPLAKDRFHRAPIKARDDLTDWESYICWFNRVGKCCDFANCWHMSEYESDPMWRLYAGEGVAVRSTYDRLCASNAHDPTPVHVGEVNYIDFRTEQPPTYGSTLAGAFLKRREYQDERELRAVVVKIPPEWGGDGPCPDTHPTFTKIAVDLNTLVERAYIAPGRAEAFTDEVRAAMERFGLDKPVEASALDDRPFWL